MTEHINLQLGWPSPSLFPASELLNGASGILNSQKKTAAALIYGPDAGYIPLRTSIARWLGSTYKPQGGVSSERICITNGASCNLGNVLAKFTEPGYTRIWMIEPSYFLACPIFSDAGYANDMRGIPEDEEGLDIEYLKSSLRQAQQENPNRYPKLKTGPRYSKLYKHLIYLVPTFANPSAKTMSLCRRRELVRLAREFDALVVSDDVYDVLRWPASQCEDASDLGPVPPRIVDVDRSLDGGPQSEWGNAVSNGSFSKLIAPGCRVGWAEATPAFALALSQVGSTRSGGCPAHATASFVHEMLESGAFEKHLQETAIPTYRSRYYTMMAAIDEYLIPEGFAVSVGKPYETTAEAIQVRNVELGNGTNGHALPSTNGHSKKRILEAGGYFTYLATPRDLPVPISKLAAIALEKYNLKFAFGEMFQVEGDEASGERARAGYGNGVRLCWAWHDESEIVEGIRRLAAVAKEVKAS